MTDPETTPNEATHEADSPPPATDAPLPAAAPETRPETAAPAARPETVAPAVPPQMTHGADPRYAFPPAPPQNSPQSRMPFLAALCSFFPGLGNVYNGLYTRGITFFVICFGLIGVAGSTEDKTKVIPIFAATFVWLFNIFDAYRQATLINYGYVPGQLPPRPRTPASGAGGLALGVAIFLFSLYFFLHHRFDVDLSIVFDNFDILGLALGAFLIGRSVLEWKKAKAESDETADDVEGI